MENKIYSLGIDVGSTTVKTVIIDDNKKIIYSKYERHFSKVKDTVKSQLEIIVDFEVGDNVRVMSGPLKDFIGIIEEISMEKKKVRVLVSMFGRETPAELEFTQIQKN